MRQKIFVVALLLGLSAPAAVTPTAYASPLDHAPAVVRVTPPTPGGDHAVVVSDTGWVTVFTVLEAGACGTVIIGQPKGQNRGTRQKRTIAYANGDVTTRLKGSVVLSVAEASDGSPGSPVPGPAKNVLIRGAVTRVDFASGAVFSGRAAPGIMAINLSPFAPGPERDAFLQAKLPGLAVVNWGVLAEYTDANAETTRLMRKPGRIQNVCDLLGLSRYRADPVLVYESEGI